MIEQAATRTGSSGFDRTGRAGRRPAEPAAAAGAGLPKTCAFALFVACLLLPGSFFLGDARFTAYRMFLLLAFLPLTWRFLRGGAGQPTLVDGLAVLYVAWIGLALVK